MGCHLATFRQLQSPTIVNEGPQMRPFLLSLLINETSMLYNYSAIAMGIYEPGQDRNVAALSNLFMCGGLVYEKRN